MQRAPYPNGWRTWACVQQPDLECEWAWTWAWAAARARRKGAVVCAESSRVGLTPMIQRYPAGSKAIRTNTSFSGTATGIATGSDTRGSVREGVGRASSVGPVVRWRMQVCQSSRAMAVAAPAGLAALTSTQPSNSPGLAHHTHVSVPLAHRSPPWLRKMPAETPEGWQPRGSATERHQHMDCDCQGGARNARPPICRRRRRMTTIQQGRELRTAGGAQWVSLRRETAHQAIDFK